MYVDDVVSIERGIVGIAKLESILGHNFHIKDLGKKLYFFRAEMARFYRTSLCQRKYVRDLS